MKSIFFSLLSIVVCTMSIAQNDEVLMTINNESIMLSEFENIYNKNNNIETAEQKNKDEYLELFINYKLKVKEAESLGLDTLQSFKKELDGYKKQLSKPYLIDSEVNTNLIKEAYNRLKEDIKASHILVKVASDASPVDTLKAYNKIMEYRKRLVQKKEDFNTVKAQIERKGDKNIISEDLGYFSAFQMVYPFESGAYNTPVGKISEPIRTSYGYHIIKVWDRRKSLGEISTAHIMIKSNEKSTEEQKKNAEAKINEIYSSLNEGQAFDSLAKIYSDDKQSALKGGALRAFTSGKMVKEFEDAAFSLKKDGDISKPVKTDYGWHIIKRLSKKELESFDKMENEIKQKVQRDRRGTKSRESLITKLKEEYNFTEIDNSKSDIITTLTYEIGKKKITEISLVKYTDKLFSISDEKYSKTNKTYTQNDFVKYVKKNGNFKSVETPSAIKKQLDLLYNKFVEDVIISFEESNLNNKYIAYKLLAKEYRDGILLFDLMDKKIWTKAVTDSAGLANFYEANKDQFMWPTRAKASVYQCSNQIIAKQVKKMVKKLNKDKISNEDILTKVNAESQLNVNINSGVFSKDENEILKQIDWKKGISENIEKNNQVFFANITEIIEAQPKKLEEAKGIITSQYQTYLENEWIKELREKYKVSVNKDVLSKVK